jgi:hypothetical protein
LSRFSWDPAEFEIRTASTIIIPWGTHVVVTDFGAYWILSAETATAQATIVITKDILTLAFDLTPSGYEFVPNVLSYSSSSLVTLFKASGLDVAGIGATLTVEEGSHVVVDEVVDTVGNSVITFSAVYNPSGPCVPVSLGNKSPIKTINGVGPAKSTGCFILGRKGTYVIDKILTPGINGISIINVGEPCCSCWDYIDAWEKCRATNTNLASIRDTIREAQENYMTLLAYVRFLLQAPIVGTSSTDALTILA